MIGFLITLLIFAWQSFIQHVGNYVAYQNALGFWYSWVFVWAILAGLAYIVFSIIFSIAGGVGGAMLGGRFGAILGFLGVGGFSVIAYIFKFVFQYGATLFGIYLMQQAWTGGDYNWFQGLFGFALTFIGFLVSLSRGSSSSSRSSD